MSLNAFEEEFIWISRPQRRRFRRWSSMLSLGYRAHYGPFRPTWKFRPLGLSNRPFQADNKTESSAVFALCPGFYDERFSFEFSSSMVLQRFSSNWNWDLPFPLDSPTSLFTIIFTSTYSRWHLIGSFFTSGLLSPRHCGTFFCGFSVI